MKILTKNRQNCVKIRPKERKLQKKSELLNNFESFEYSELSDNLDNSELLNNSELSDNLDNFEYSENARR